MSFRSRVSVWLCLFMLAAFLLPIAIIASLEDNMPWEPIVLIFVSMDVAFPLLFCIRYTIDGNMLYVGYKFFRGKGYDLTKLESIKPTRSILSAPAASLKRIRLDFGCGDPLVISPAAQDYFIEEILRINPNVKVE